MAGVEICSKFPSALLLLGSSHLESEHEPVSGACALPHLLLFLLTPFLPGTQATLCSLYKKQLPSWDPTELAPCSGSLGPCKAWFTRALVILYYSYPPVFVLCFLPAWAYVPICNRHRILGKPQ